MLVHEGLHAVEPLLLPIRHREVHAMLLTLFLNRFAAPSPRHPRVAIPSSAAGNAAVVRETFAPGALTQEASNHGFIQVFELQRLGRMGP
jgi:hypothetical protein